MRRPGSAGGSLESKKVRDSRMIVQYKSSFANFDRQSWLFANVLMEGRNPARGCVPPSQPEQWVPRPPSFWLFQNDHRSNAQRPDNFRRKWYRHECILLPPRFLFTLLIERPELESLNQPPSVFATK